MAPQLCHLLCFNALGMHGSQYIIVYTSGMKHYNRERNLLKDILLLIFTSGCNTVHDTLQRYLHHLLASNIADVLYLAI